MDDNRVTLSSGAALPLLGFGTWQLQGRAAYDAVRYALDVGYRHFDTAAIYRNEDQVGRALHDSGVPREEVFLTTKIPPREAGRNARFLRPALPLLGLTGSTCGSSTGPEGRAPIWACGRRCSRRCRTG